MYVSWSVRPPLSGGTHHIRSESKHQRKRVPQGIQSADNRGTPRLMDLPAPWDPTDGELGNKDKCPSGVLRDAAVVIATNTDSSERFYLHNEGFVGLFVGLSVGIHTKY